MLHLCGMTKSYFLTPPDLLRLTETGEISISLDCGITKQVLQLDDHMMRGRDITLPLPPQSLTNDRTILIFQRNEWQKWQRFDEETNNFYKMVFVAEGKPPTVEISGIKMHVTMDGDPELDTQRKLAELKRIHGNILDVCCGLGYTAQALANIDSVEHVTVFERDTNMLALCKENPWSAGLWTDSKIKIIQQNASDGIAELPESHYSAVLHDPPRYALASELYSVNFYRQLHRVLTKRGRLYHYTGNPNQQRRKSLPERTIERLLEAGFRKATIAYQGVKAIA